MDPPLETKVVLLVELFPVAFSLNQLLLSVEDLGLLDGDVFIVFVV